MVEGHSPRNMVAGTLAKRTGLQEGVAIKPPIVRALLQVDPAPTIP